MGSGSSLFRPQDEEDVLGVGFGSSQGVVKRIPIEMKPRGKLGLRTVRSLGKPKGGSLRSALSIDLENPEVERIRKDFDMYRLNKENDLANMLKKVQKLETENKRLRVELQTLQKTCRKLRDERDGAIEAEHQGLVRSAAFENDRDKIQRQFKIFRETKESEIQNLLKTRRDLENKLLKLAGQGLLEDGESGGNQGSVGGSHPGDWWTALESEPSLGSTTQLHPGGVAGGPPGGQYRGPEFGHTLMETDGPYLNVNKDDWTLAAASLASTLPTLPESLQTNTVRIFVSAPPDTRDERETFIQKYGPRLSSLCSSEGRFCVLIHMPCDEGDKRITQEAYIRARCRQIDQATMFLAFLCQSTEQYTRQDCNLGHLNNPGGKPAVFCFRDGGKGSTSDEVSDLHKKVKVSGSVKVIEDYTSAQQGAELAFNEVEKIIKFELGIDRQSDSLESILELDGPSALCGGCLWDINLDFEQIEALAFAGRSSCEMGFEKCYERLSAHVAAPGPLPPLMICGPSGSGKSLLLAKWIGLQQHKSSGSLVIHHFVGSPSSVSADPLVMIRRLTNQLMQQMTSPPALTCDPIRLVEEFPKWLERVSAKTAGGVVLVLDAIDRLQCAESQLKWLLDPLPVDSRIIISVHDDTCPPSWKFWPTLHLEELSNKKVKELLRAELASFGTSIRGEHEQRILTHCRTPSTCHPLYVVLLANDLARCSSEECISTHLTQLLRTSDATELYKVLLDNIVTEHEPVDSKGLLKTVLLLVLASRNGVSDSELFSLVPSLTWTVWAPMCDALSCVLLLVLASRNGVSDSELFSLVPSLTWTVWAPMCDALVDSLVLTYRSGLLVYAHTQAQEAAGQRFGAVTDISILTGHRQMLIDLFSKLTKPGDVTYRVADELPWLNRQTENREQLRNNLLDLCIFVKLYGRGRCGELISLWSYIGIDRGVMAKTYYDCCKGMEDMVGEFNGLVTLPRVADVYEALGRFLRDLGLLNEALTPLQRALEIRETALDPDHPSVAQTLHQVAGVHAQQAKFTTAELLYKQAVEIYVGALGREHFLVARELDALAVLYQKQGKHQLAEPLHKRAMSIRKKSRVPRLSSSHIRGVDPLRRRVLHLEELAMGPDSAYLARTINEIGVLYYLQNNVSSAESFFKKSLEMRESVSGPESADVAQSLNNLAALYNDTKQYDKAQPLYEQALAIRRKLYSDDHPSVLVVEKHLALLYKKMKRPGAAEPLYTHLVTVRERGFGASHPSVATALVNLAVLHSQQGNHAVAEPLYQRALLIYEDTFGPSHPRVSETLRNLALLKYDQGEYETAASLYKRATEMRADDGKGTMERARGRAGSAL